MAYTVDSSLFTVYWRTALFQVYSLSITLLLYGIYLVLFIFSIHSLSRRKPGGRHVLLCASCVMLLLGTVQVALRISTTAVTLRILQQIVEGFPTFQPSEHWVRADYTVTLAQDCVLVTNNLVADGLFLYRCYLIWGSQKKIVVVPGLFILATTVLGYFAVVSLDSIDNLNPSYLQIRIAFVMGLIANSGLTLLTAGRIIWIRRQLSATEIRDSSRFDTAITIILESGAMYCASFIILVICLSRTTFAPIASVFHGAAGQVVNIIPALTIVRVGMGRNIVDDVELNSRRESRSRVPPRKFATGLDRVSPDSEVIYITTES
ncbi:hypothetical protein FB451DRAFT_1282777 [Mycena latifolia]|nr:hypothetical protein FB451DRAFT_1282777 [Mycena latifolia]